MAPAGADASSGGAGASTTGAGASPGEDARLFEVWRGSVAVCGGILDKLAGGGLGAAHVREATGALTSLLRGAGEAAGEVERAWCAKRREREVTMGVLFELRALATEQRLALDERSRSAAAARSGARGASTQTVVAESEAEAALRARCADLEDALAAEREATRIAKVVCETLQRRARRLEDDAADARAAEQAARAKAHSLERIVDHLEAAATAVRADDRRLGVGAFAAAAPGDPRDSYDGGAPLEDGRPTRPP